VRAKGLAFSVSGLFVATIIFLQVAPTAFDEIGWKYYLLFIIITSILFVVVWLYFPEASQQIGINAKSELTSIRRVSAHWRTLENFLVILFRNTTTRRKSTTLSQSCANVSSRIPRLRRKPRATKGRPTKVGAIIPPYVLTLSLQSITHTQAPVTRQGESLFRTRKVRRQYRIREKCLPTYWVAPHRP